MRVQSVLAVGQAHLVHLIRLPLGIYGSIKE